MSMFLTPGFGPQGLDHRVWTLGHEFEDVMLENSLPIDKLVLWITCATSCHRLAI